MPLFAKTFQDLVAETVNDLSTDTNITLLSAGGKARAILESLNSRLAEAYTTFDAALARAFISSASGAYLDIMGVLLNLPRQPATQATAGSPLQIQKFYVTTGTFGSINGGSSIVLPAETVVSTRVNNKGVLYRLISQTTLLSTASSAWVGVEALVPGGDSNVGSGSLIFHDFTDYSDKDNRTLLTTNVHAIANGKDFESDTNYRFRLSQRIVEAEAGNEIALRLAGLSVAGVANITVIPYYHGIGTLLLLIDSTTPTVSEALKAAVEAKVKKVSSSGDLVFVTGPKEIGLALELTVYYKNNPTADELVVLEQQIEDRIEQYVNGIGTGNDFSVNALSAEVFGVSDQISNLGSPNQPFDAVYIYHDSKLQDSRIRQTLLGDYITAEDERVIIEPYIKTPILLKRGKNK